MESDNRLADLVLDNMQQSLNVKRSLLQDTELVGQVARVGVAICRAFREGNRLYLFGNGGSAADAQHIAAELVGRYRMKRQGLPATALTVNSSSLTAIGNDYSFDHVFARQLEALGTPGDIAIAISTSGRSPNVIRALESAAAKGMIRVGLTGQDGGMLKRLVNHCIQVPSKITARIQEGHILIGHILCEIVEAELFSQ